MLERRVAPFKDLVNTDPRRAVCVLTVANNQPNDSGTRRKAQYIMLQLLNLSENPKSGSWQRLVHEGLFDALSLSVVNTQPPDIIESGTKSAQANAEYKKVPSPWALPLHIMRTAAFSCGETATDIETKMVEDMRRNWGQMVQRIWSQPFNSLDPDMGVAERILVAHTAMRLTVLDPSFLGELTRSSDLTLTVCLRNWMYSIGHEDASINANFLLTILNQHQLPENWKPYIEANPLPSTQVLFPRIILGASKTYGATQRKRTPQQTAEAIIAATIAHLTYSNAGLQEYGLELAFLRKLFIHAKTEYPALPRAMFKSPDLWTTVALVLRKAAESGTHEAQQTYLYALETFSGCTFVNQEANEFADALIAHWVEGGLLETLEDTVDFLVKVRGATRAFVIIMSTFLQCSPKLSATTQALLHAHFPRQRLSEHLVETFSYDEKEREQYKADWAAFTTSMQSGTLPGADNPMWGQVAWETLDSVTELFQATKTAPCSRSGCEKQIAHGNEVKCANCTVQYCSKQCFKRDLEEHKGTCSDPKRQPSSTRKFVIGNIEKHVRASPYFKRKYLILSLITVIIAIIAYSGMYFSYGPMISL